MTTETTKTTKPRARTPKPAVAASPTAAPNATAANPAPIPATAAAAPTKSATVIKLLLRAKGATPVELIAATDWQPHSLRAFLSGLRKKGRVLVREERKGGGYAYRIVADPPAPTAAAGDAAQHGDAA